MNPKYQIEDFKNYVCGWLEAEEAKSGELSLNNMKAALNNALITIDDPNDGIDWFSKYSMDRVNKN
jgi:hypothetical protein